MAEYLAYTSTSIPTIRERMKHALDGVRIVSGNILKFSKIHNAAHRSRKGALPLALLPQGSHCFKIVDDVCHRSPYALATTNTGQVGDFLSAADSALTLNTRQNVGTPSQPRRPVTTYKLRK